VKGKFEFSFFTAPYLLLPQLLSLGLQEVTSWGLIGYITKEEILKDRAPQSIKGV